MNENKGSLKANGSTELGESSESGSSSSSSSSENGEVQKVDDAAEMEDASTYEGVSATDFGEFSEMVEMRLDAITASSIVIVFCLFICCGILAVGTFIRSLESWNT